MARLRYIGQGAYRGHGTAWPQGEVREVDEHEEKFIRRHVADDFETEDGEPLGAAPAGGERKPEDTSSRTKPAGTKKK